MQVGLTFEKVLNDVVDGHIENYREKCILEPTPDQGDSMTKDDIVFFRFDLKNLMYVASRKCVWKDFFRSDNKLFVFSVETSCSAETSVANLLIFKSIDSLLEEDGRDLRFIPPKGT